jgi:protoheme ferro-lyase
MKRNTSIALLADERVHRKMGNDKTLYRKETATLVAEELKDVLNPSDWHFAFQCHGMSGGPWIGPTVEDRGN